MIDGVTSRPFSATGIPPIARPEFSYTKEIIDLSRAQFATPREEVEEKIKDWHVQKIGAKEPAKKASDRSIGDRSTGDRPAQERGREDRGRGNVRMQKSDRLDGVQRPEGVERTERPDRTRERSDRMNRATNEERPRIVGEDKSVIKPIAPPVDVQKPVESVINQPLVSITPTPSVSPVVKSTVSLNALSSNNVPNNENKAKNNQKDIKPENVAALREALLSVMGEDSSKTEIKKEEKPKVIEEKKEEQEEKKSENHTGQLTPDELKRILDIEE